VNHAVEYVPGQEVMGWKSYPISGSMPWPHGERSQDGGCELMPPGMPSPTGVTFPKGMQSRKGTLLLQEDTFEQSQDGAD